MAQWEIPEHRSCADQARPAEEALNLTVSLIFLFQVLFNVCLQLLQTSCLKIVLAKGWPANHVLTDR